MGNVGATDPELWLDDHGDYMYRYALGRLRNTTLAEDAVQETFLAALRARDSFSGRSSERTWLFGILKHKIIDQLRKSSRESVLSGTNEAANTLDDLFDAKGMPKEHPAAWPGNPRDDFERNQFWECLNECLGKLPERLSKAFSLREVDGMESGEICKVLGITATNYWVILHRARLALRKCIEINWFGLGTKGGH